MLIWCTLLRLSRLMWIHFGVQLLLVDGDHLLLQDLIGRVGLLFIRLAFIFLLDFVGCLEKMVLCKMHLPHVLIDFHFVGIHEFVLIQFPPSSSFICMCSLWLCLCEPAAPPAETNGYLRVRCNGGLNQQRSAVCNKILLYHWNSTHVLHYSIPSC